MGIMKFSVCLKKKVNDKILFLSEEDAVMKILLLFE